VSWDGKYPNIYIGTDPEVFVRDDNGLLPAFKFLPPKENAETFYSKWANARVFWDGFQAEFGCTANCCIAYTVDSVRDGLRGTLELARKNSPTAKLTLQNVFQIPAKTLRLEKEEHVLLGCNPSQNAYGMLGEHVLNARKLRYRFAGGHLHLGIASQKYNPKELESFVRFLDSTLGVWSVGAAASFDKPLRRKYYGLAGEYRTPEHGLEYRTLSNFWLAHPGLANLVMMFTRALHGAFQYGGVKEWVAHPQEVVEIINNSDVRKARKLLELNQKMLTKVFSSATYGYLLTNPENSPNIQQGIRIGFEGLESVIPTPEDFELNWKLDEARTGEWKCHCDGKMESWKDLCQSIPKAA